MPDAKLPQSLAGWLVTILASLAGFIAGLVVINVMRNVMGK